VVDNTNTGPQYDSRQFYEEDDEEDPHPQKYTAIWEKNRDSSYLFA